MAAAKYTIGQRRRFNLPGHPNPVPGYDVLTVDTGECVAFIHQSSARTEWVITNPTTGTVLVSAAQSSSMGPTRNDALWFLEQRSHIE